MIHKSSSARGERFVIFDGDDTLWDTQELYDAAKCEFFDLLAELGHGREAAAQKFAEIDLRNVRHLGFSRRRFPTSMQQTYEFLCAGARQDVRSDVAARVSAIAEAVFERNPTVRPDAREALNLLRPHYSLALFTAGDDEVQWARIRQSGLEPHFDIVRVTPGKSRETWASIVRAQVICASAAWSVGNSVRSDINPALELGLRCVLVHGGGWEFEQAPILEGDVWRAQSLREAAAVVLREDGLQTPLVADDAHRHSGKARPGAPFNL